MTAFVTAAAPDKRNSSRARSGELDNLNLQGEGENPDGDNTVVASGNLVRTEIVDITLPDGWLPKRP